MLEGRIEEKQGNRVGEGKGWKSRGERRGRDMEGGKCREEHEGAKCNEGARCPLTIPLATH
jgi:hypothetical protein